MAPATAPRRAIVASAVHPRRATDRIEGSCCCVRPLLYGSDMADHSAIEWTEATWNPTTGCDRTSPGCDNCYALTLAKRLKAMGQAKYQNDGDPRIYQNKGI